MEPRESGTGSGGGGGGGGGRQRPPSVLVVMSDQQKATASHLYGSPFCDTPSMDRLAKRGVLYETACTPHPLCVPARCAFWCSQYAHTTGCRRNETLLPPGAPHAMRLWSEQGFRLGLIGKNHCFHEPDDLALFNVLQELGHGGASGSDWGRPPTAIEAAARERRELQGQNPRFSYGTTTAPLEDQTTGLVTDQSIKFLEQHAAEHSDQPFVLWTSYPDPHEPWVCPEQYAAMYRGKVALPPWRPGEFDADSGAPERNRVLHHMLGVEGDDSADVLELLACYYGMLRCVDDGLGRLLDTLERLGLEEDTIVVFTSDHGDFMGEHAQQCKGGVFYDCLTRVPLIISWPGHPDTPSVGVREPSICSTIDVVPTLLTLQGLPIPPTMQGAALPHLVSSAEPREEAFSEYGAGGPPFTLADLQRLPQPWGRATLIATLQWREAEGRRKMCRTKDWKYVHDAMGTDLDELYDLRNDPWELVNRAADPSPRYQQALHDMSRRPGDWSMRTEDASPIPMPPPGAKKGAISAAPDGRRRRPAKL